MFKLIPTFPAHPIILAGLVACTAYGTAIAETRVGVSSAVNRTSTLERGTAQRTIVVGDNINHKDKIITSKAGLTQVLFVDGSTFTVGSNSRVVIDEFVYNPATGSGSLVTEVTRGALRFVGGKLSKNKAPVQFKTPVGILGVRGAISEIDLNPDCLSGKDCPIMIASLIFGNEMTLTQTNGRKRRVYQAGHAIVVYKNGKSKIVPLASLKRGSVQQRLAGDPGQNGGAVRVPTAEDVVKSRLPENNSGRAPFVIRPRPRPEVVATALAPDEDTPGIGDLTLALGVTVTEQAQNDFVRGQIEMGEPVDPEDPILERGTLTGVFGTPPFYTTDNGAATVGAPWSANIVTQLDDTTLPVSLLETSAGNPVAVEIGDLTFAYPIAEGETEIDPTFSEEYQVNVTDGTILRGPSGFALYYLALEDAETEDPSSLYVVIATPTPRELFYPDTPNARAAEVRTYTLGEDYARSTQGIVSDVPLLNPEVALSFGNAFLTAAAETPMYMIERVDVTRSTHTLYGALRIEGQGAAQRSMIVSDSGIIFGSIVGTGEDALGYGGTRRGSYRLSSTDESVIMRGGTGSVEVDNAEIRTAITGSNGEVFLYSSGVDIGLARNSFRDEREFIDVTLSDPLLAPTSGDQYSSMMVPAILSSQEALSGFDREMDGMTVHGYAAGMIESADGLIAPFRSRTYTDVEMQFDAERSNFGGLITTADVTNADTLVAGYRYAFGFDITGTFDEASSGRGAYLDDNRFAANSTGPGDYQGGNTTLLFTDVGTEIAHQPTTSLTPADPGTYVVSSGLTPQPELFSAADVTPCNCNYMNWGWWGTQTQFVDDSLPGGSRTDFVHLGTWATGDIPAAAELPTSGSGTFRGHAIGNVARSTEGGVAQYIAVGNLAMTYDFGERSGLLSIDNFDSRSFSGTMTGAAADNRFSGALSGSGLAGQAVGSFARGPASVAQGVLGTFNVGSGGYNATGTFMGSQ